MSRFALSVLTAACLIAAEPEKKTNPAIGDPKAIEAGRKLFSTGCAGCHGQTGEGGRGPKLRAGTMWHNLDDQGLFDTIKKGVPGADMPASTLPEEQIWQLAAFVRSINAPAVEANVPGNVQAGQELFWGKAGCSNCHAIRGRGSMMGPDLSNAGGVRSIEQLREDLLAPDADGYEAYRKVTAITRDGTRIEGLLRNRTNYSLQLQDSKGELRFLPTFGLREITLEKKSPMPSDYKARLSRDEVRDLLAFLSRQSVRPPGPESK